MKKIIISIVAVATLVALPMIVMAQNSDGVTGVISAAKIATAIDLSTDGAKLDFGTIRSGIALGTVTLTGGSPIGRAATGGVTLLASTSTIPTFTVTGEVDYAYTISFKNVIPLSDGNSHTMSVTIGAANATTGATKTGGTLASGTDNFMLNAELSVAGSQAVGVYGGTFDVDVTYN